MIIIIIVPKKLTTTSASSLKNRFDHHLAAFALLSLAVLLFLPLPPGIQKYEISRCNYKSLQFQDAITKVCNFKMQLHLSPLPAPPLVPPLISSLTHWLAAFSCILLTSASAAPPLVLLVTLQVQQPLKNVNFFPGVPKI